MASSDEEGEPVLRSVSDYSFVDNSNDPVSFSELPVQWSDGERTGGKQNQIFIHGSTDNGLQKIYKQVEAWKFDLSNVKPEILVLLSKENNWMTLEKPRKSHEEIFRTILITLQTLHFLRKNPEASGRSLHDHLCKVFRFEPGPSEIDLVNHANLISEVVKRDEVLAKAKIVTTFLDKDSREWKFFDRDAEATTVTKSPFIVDDDIFDETGEAESDDEEEGDKVCAICDNGGDILCCEGKCLRSFHATEEAGADSSCVSLGLSDEQVEAIQNFYCKNCQYKRHQCFACGELGSSDDTSSAVEVFRCVSGECGRFYHPLCVSKLLHPARESEAKELERKISNGAAFTCPFHKCCVCKQTETEGDPELRFAMCRRCPKSYHKKCLPREIVFDGSDDEVLARAWEHLMPKKRILIYCLEHEIDEELATPLRDHIKFPHVEKKKQPSKALPCKEKVAIKKRNLVLEDGSRNKTYLKPSIGVDKVSSATKQGGSTKRGIERVTGVDLSKKQKVNITRQPSRSASIKAKSTQGKNTPSLGLQLHAAYFGNREQNSAPCDNEHDQTYTIKSIATKASSLPPIDAESERRILALMKDATSSVSLADINEKHKMPTTHAYSSKLAIDRTITLGKVEGSVEALREAVKKLEEGGSIDDAKAVCGPGLLNEMMKWKSKLRVYLAPFLYGMRYTSFGRHFTKTDKLQKVVDMLHWYAEEGDMIVDFCCGANEFSCLMKKRLDEVGKRCYYKNYDVMQPKNDFNFEKRDWMTVDPTELPSGSQLIMGLNPPFGVKAALANKFIDKALKFKPKLIVLIVPPETERLDNKDPPYDLVYEDSALLSGKSFYLPGSVDINDKQMDQWNATPPPLSFWSRTDWTAKHKAIAEKHGDKFRRQQISHMVDNYKETHVHVFPVEDNKLNNETPMQSYGRSLTAERARQLNERTSVTESRKEGFPCDLGGSGSMIHNSSKNQLDVDSNKKCSEEKHKIGSSELSQEQKQKRGLSDISLEDKQKKRGSGDVSVEDKHKTELRALVAEDKEKRTPGEVSCEDKLKQRGSCEIFPGEKKAGGSGEKALEDENIKIGTGEILMKDMKRRVSHDISPDSCKKKRGLNDNLPEVRQERRGHETFPEDRYKRRGSYEPSPEVRQETTVSREISPMDKQNSSFLHNKFQPVETPLLAGVQTESFQRFDGRVSGSQQLRAGYSGVGEDGMAHRYEAFHEDPYQTSLYRNRNPDVQYPDYQRESTNYHGYMPHVDSPLSQRNSHIGSYDLRIPAPYENISSAADLSYNRSVPDLSYNRSVSDLSYNRSSTSAMQRYAPRLDELNTRVNNLGPDPALPTSGIYDPRAPRPSYLGNSMGYYPDPYFRQ